MKQVHIFVSGEVQGVGYRFWAKSAASKMGLKGWVKNLQEGRVELVVQGDELKLKQFIDRAKEGPFTAEVKNVEENWEEIDQIFEGFVILR